MAGAEYRSFRDFYPFYLTEHSKSGTRCLHFAGTLLVLLTLGYVLVAQQWRFLALLPVFGYGFAWVAHCAEERIGHHLAGVEAGPAGHAGAGENLHDLVLGALRGPRFHEAIDLVPALPAGLRRLVARIPDEILASDGAQERMPHLLLGEDEDVVIRPAGMAAVRRARHVRAELIARSRRRLAEALVIAEAHADEVHHHVLHGDLDLLALPGLVALHEPGEDPDHAVHARAGVSDGRPDIRGRAVGEARDAHASPHGLGDRLVALVVAVRSVGTEPLDARVHEARVERLHGGIAEAQAIEDARPEVLEEHVGRLQEGSKDLLASGVL